MGCNPGRVAAAVALAVALGACGKSRTMQGGADASAALSDTGADANEAGHASLVEAGPADDALPPAQTDELAARARHLLEAIAKDDSTLSADIVFPRDGWLATRDSPDGGKEWEKRVSAPFRRALHVLSRRRKNLDQARFVSLELGSTVAQETVRRHGWTKPLWTVRGSRLTFVIDGRTATLPVREMTAWRGAWYVTRLR
jgi:hypothetical protein